MIDKVYTKCKTCDFNMLFKKKGYAFFTKGSFNLNIIGVRSNKNNEVTNEYDDYLVVIYDSAQGIQRKIYHITTEPGRKYMKNPSCAKGTAILAPGQYRGAYKIDRHNGKYYALCQRNKPVKVYRDNNRDNVYDYNPKTVDTGMFGINIHRSNELWTRKTVDGYSAGCQVFNNPAEFESFMRLVRKSADLFGNCFTYTLVNEEDLDEFC